LQVISVRFFRNDAKYKTIKKDLIKNIFKGLIGDITFRRFSLYRSARMPVKILEGNKGEMIKRRIRNLKNGGLDFCALLTLLCITLEIALFGVFSLFSFALFAEYSDLTFYTISQYSSQISFVVLVISSLTFLIVEPLYMCMGFGIYINSRSIVEGWDIELGLNSFVEEKKSESLKIKTIPMIISLILLLNVFMPVQVQAEEWYQQNSDEVPIEVLDEVFSSEDFGNHHTRKWIRFKDFTIDESYSDLHFDEANIKEVVGVVLRALLVVIIAASLVFAIYRLLDMKTKTVSNKSVPWRKGIVPKFAQQDDPEILVDTARKLFEEGQIRKAWAACLSAVLGLYAKQGNINFAVNDTESDCLVKINASLLWGKEKSSQLILHWIQLAYAGIKPLPEKFQSAVLFFNELKTQLSYDGDVHE
jgi:hypothetical protein